MSEENKIETADSGIDFNNSNEPIDSIEKTVENLKKKIQELNENTAEAAEETIEAAADKAEEIKEELSAAADEICEAAEEKKEEIAAAVEEKKEEIKEAAEEVIAEATEETEEKAEEIAEAADDADDGFTIPDFVSNEKPDKFEELKEKAFNTVSMSLESIKGAYDKAMANPAVQNGVNAVKDNVGKAIETAKVQASKLSENEDVKKFTDKAGETWKKASDAVSEGTKEAARKIDETLSKPEVQDTIAKAKTGAAGLFTNVKNSVLSLFAKKEEAEEDAEGISAEKEEEEAIQNLTDSDSQE